jgi:hypothetical protein
MEKSFAARPFLAKELSMTSLRRRMTEDMQVRNLSSQTQAAYVHQVSLFARHFNKSPEILGPEEIRSYQVYLTNEKKARSKLDHHRRCGKRPTTRSGQCKIRLQQLDWMCLGWMNPIAFSPKTGPKAFLREDASRFGDMSSSDKTVGAGNPRESLDHQFKRLFAGRDSPRFRRHRLEPIRR